MSDPSSDADEIKWSLVDPERFAVIFDRHFATVHRFLSRRLGPDGAEALAGEVFRIAFERRGTYHLDRPDCLPWLYGIAKHLLDKERRRQARHLRALSRLHAEDRSEDDGRATDDRIDAQARWLQVATALNTLSVGERDVLLLIAWEDLNYREVSEVLDVPIGTVRSRLHRARGRLRELISPSGEERDDNPLRAEGGHRP